MCTAELPSTNGRDASLLQQASRARGWVDPGPENRIPLPHHNGSDAGGEARLHESHSSGSERSSSRYKQQQVQQQQLQDRWRYDKQNPVFNNEVSRLHSAQIQRISQSEVLMHTMIL